MKKSILITVLLPLCLWLQSGFAPAVAQSAAKADDLFLQQRYQESLVQYEALLRGAPQNQLYRYRYARCLQETGRYAEALTQFEEAGERYALRNFYLAMLYEKAYRFDEAVETMEKYLASIDTLSERYDAAIQILTSAKKGSRYLRRVADIQIIDSVIMPKAQFLSAYRLSSESGTLTEDSVGVVYTNARGDRRLLTGTDAFGQKRLLSCQRLIGDDWSACDTLPEPVNPDHSAAEQTVSVSYPYMLSDGVTLYYASDSPDGLGGYDIYSTRYNISSKSWLTPENMGFPFNSASNDYMMAVDEATATGFFATDRRSDSASVAVYSFRYEPDRRVLRDTTDEYIRQAAQLLNVGLSVAAAGETAQPQEESTVAVETLNTDSLFTIVITDTLVYTAFGHFRSDEARHAAQEYVSLCVQIEEEQLSLDAQRERFRLAETEEERSMLRPVILTQEKTLRTLYLHQQELIKHIRMEELSARGG